MASLLDMSQIPLPDAVEELDFATIEAATKADYVARMRADDPTYVLSVNDPAARALEVLAFREMILRARVNDAVRGTLLASATGTQLDDLGADPAYGPTPRLIVTAESLGPPFVPAVLETDADYRKRLSRAPHEQSVAGPAGAYESLARGAHGDVIDVAITRTAPGEILVEVLHDGDEEEVLAAVESALGANDVRPIGDLVTVVAATHVVSTIAVTVYVDDGPDLAAVQSASQARVNNLLLPKCARVRSGEALSQGEEFGFLGACVVDGMINYKVTASSGMTPVSTAWWPMTIAVTALRASGLVIELPGGGGGDPIPTDPTTPIVLVPTELIKLGGGSWTVAKNWDFGTSGNIGTPAQLAAEFDPYNLFGSINNGGAYGTDTVAPTADSALESQVVDTTNRFRQFLSNSMLAHVRAWTDGNAIGPASEHNGGNGSIYSKFKYAAGGSDLGKDIVWETRFRIQNPTPGQWFALWTLGNIWDGGPEMDVIEAFSAWEGLESTAWHSDSVNGENEIDYFGDGVTFWDGQIEAGYPQDGQNSLALWHVITYVYRADDTFEVWMDGIKIQHGTMTWRVPQGDHEGQSVNMQFGLDFSALHATVGDYVSLTIPANRLPITYEIDYSRVFEKPGTSAPPVPPEELVPTEMANIGGADFTLVKNWDFGTSGNVGNVAQLDAQFQYHDPFNTVANGHKYGTTTVATSPSTAINVYEVPVPTGDGTQPVDPGNRFREFTANSIRCHVKPWVDGNSIGPASEHNGGNGSFCSKFFYPNGGSDLGKTIVWETRFRMINAPVGYWFALWTCGEAWDGGPEMDVIEAYSDTEESGLRNGDAFHVNSVGGVDERFDFGDSWFVGMDDSGMPGITEGGQQNLKNWHKITWVYRADNSYEVWIDGYKFQQGTLEWRVPTSDAQTRMYFLFDMLALQTELSPINSVVMPPSDLPLSYEIDYSRIWEREED